MSTATELQTQVNALKAEQAQAATLLQISRGLSAARDEDELLQALAQPAIAAGATAVDLAYFDLDEAGEPEWLEMVATWRRKGSSGVPPGARFYLPEFPMSRLWLANPKEAQLIGDTTSDERVDKNAGNLLAQLGIRALIIIPLTQAGRWVGLLIFAWDEPHTFNAQETEIARALIDLASPAVENRRLLARTQKALGELRRLQMAVEQSIDGIAVADLEGNLQFVNPAWAQMHGYSAEELLGKNLSVCHTEEQVREDVIPFNKQVMETGAHQGEIGHVRKDGVTFSTWMAVSVLRDDKGNPAGLLGTARDITAQKQAEEALKAQQAFLHRVIEAIPGRIFWKDGDLNYLGCNQRFAEDAGLTSPEEVIGKNDFDLGWREQAELYRADDRQVIESGTAKINYEEPQTTPDGSMIWLRTSKVPIYDVNGKVTGVLGIYDDITAQKQLEAEREQMQQEVIEAQRQALRDLSTPIIPVMEGIIVMPLVGSIDTMRAKDIMRALLKGISAYRAKVVILDITGVPLVDSGVASHLDKTIQAARLKGTRTIVTGITDAVAETIVDLGIDWGGIETLRDLQTGLLVALDRLGFTLNHAGK